MTNLRNLFIFSFEKQTKALAPARKKSEILTHNRWLELRNWKWNAAKKLLHLHYLSFGERFKLKSEIFYLKKSWVSRAAHSSFPVDSLRINRTRSFDFLISILSSFDDYEISLCQSSFCSMRSTMIPTIGGQQNTFTHKKPGASLSCLNNERHQPNVHALQINAATTKKNWGAHTRNFAFTSSPLLIVFSLSLFRCQSPKYIKYWKKHASKNVEN